MSKKVFIMTTLEKKTLDLYYTNVYLIYSAFMEENEWSDDDFDGSDAAYDFFTVCKPIDNSIMNIDKYELKSYIKHLCINGDVFNYAVSAIIANSLVRRDKIKYGSLFLSLFNFFEKNYIDDYYINNPIEYCLETESIIVAAANYDISLYDLYNSFPEYEI